MQQKELLTKKDFATIGEEISHDMAADFVGSYRNAHPQEIAGWNIGRNILDQILAQPGCVAMRFYNAINEKGQKTLVYVGVDADGKDIVKKVVVLENGSLATTPAIVADRSGGIDWPSWLPWGK